ncbi:MAG: WS/DGAT domain-containing protein [Myxococcota bacterium]
MSKVHHAAIDGVSGADILGLLFDVTPEAREVKPPPHTGRPEPIPSDVELLARSGVHMATRPAKIPNLLWETVKSSAAARVVRHIERIKPPPPAFSAPRTPINGPVSSNRVWNTALLSLDRVKQLKNSIQGTTLNDAVLTICAGALRRYLLRRGMLPDEPLVAMVPVSTRANDQHNASGNQVSMMFIQLATDIADPVERFKKIHANAAEGKIYYKATNAKKLMEYGELIPFGLAGQAARVYSRVHLAEYHRPIFNVVITNVPGPQLPLYLAGKRLLAHMGTAPIFEGMGLMIPVFSYNGVLSISPTSSDNLMPDLDDFARDLRESANALEAAVLNVAPKTSSAPAGGHPNAVTKVFHALQSHLAAHPGMELPGQGVVYQFDVTGAQAQQWSFDLQGSPPAIVEGPSPHAACVLKMEDRHMVSMVQGELDGTTAFMQGKLKVEGDINKAINFGKVLDAFPDTVAREALASA